MSKKDEIVINLDLEVAVDNVVKKFGLVEEKKKEIAEPVKLKVEQDSKNKKVLKDYISDVENTYKEMANIYAKHEKTKSDSQKKRHSNELEKINGRLLAQARGNISQDDVINGMTSALKEMGIEADATKKKISDLIATSRERKLRSGNLIDYNKELRNATLGSNTVTRRSRTVTDASNQTGILSENKSDNHVKESANNTAESLYKEGRAARDTSKDMESLAKSKADATKTNIDLKESADNTASSVSKEGNASKNASEEIKKSKVTKIDTDTFNENVFKWCKNFKNDLLDTGNFLQVVEENVSQTEKGIVKFSACVQEADGTWRKYQARLNDTGGLEKVLKGHVMSAGEVEKLEKKLSTPNARDTTNVTKAYDDYAKAIDNVAKVEQKIAKGKATARDESNLIKYKEKLAEKQKIVLFLEQQGLTIAEKRNEIERIRIANQKTLDDILSESKRSPISDLYKKYSSQYNKKLKNKDNYPKEYSNKLSEIKNKLSELEKYENLDIINEKEIEDAKKLGGELGKIFKELGNISKNGNKAKASNLAANIEQYLKALTKSGKQTREARSELKGFVTELQSSDISSKRIQEIAAAFGNLKVKLEEANKTGRGFADIFANKLKYGVAQQLAMYFSLNDFLRYGRQGIGTIKELDTALIDLRKTTTMNADSLNQFYFESNDIAKDMGAGTEEIISQAAAWSRLGYSSKEASEQMSELSSKFASISPGMDTETSQTGLVSIMKAWDIGTEDVERKIMDNINTLGNKFAENNTDIITGMEKAAATFSALGQSTEDAFALFTGAQEVQQNAEIVGTALKTLSLRIRGYSEETEELDDSLRTIKGDVVDLTKTESNPTGISLFTDESQTEYRSMVDYLRDISNEWDDIDAKSQTDLLDKLFGKRGASVGSAIIKNFDSVDAALEEMEKAGGSADAEMDIIRNSIDYKINALKETWVGFIQEVAGREDVGDIVDSLTEASVDFGKALEGIVPILKNVMDFASPLISIIGGLSSAFGGFTPFLALGGVMTAKGFGKAHKCVFSFF